ncbi:MAG: FAD-dependent oxidoreductase, partial [Eubacteriales bacterium]|nr:FAD-dependent oxidoreductase [Eubacteriales bacterium]
EVAASTGKKVAVIGGGPSGLSAAFYLTIMGHDVTVYEQRKQLGGMLRYGIPNYRLPRAVLDREISNMKAVGFKTICDISVGKDITLKELHDQYDAIYVSIGAHTGSKLSIEGDDAEGVISAVDILREIGDDKYPDFTGEHIAVVGGGNVAMDVARTAIRCGAKTVRIIYRRRIADMTALPEEIHGAIEDGCEVSELLAPLRIEKDREGKVRAIWVRHQISGPMVNGRPSIVESRELEDVRIPCDRLLVAVGQGIDSQKFGDYGIPLQRGRIAAFDTSDVKDTAGLFAGGDCVTGPATVIRAIAAGKVAAANIDEYLGFNHVIRTSIDLPQVRFDDHRPCGRINMRERPAQIRKYDFELMETGMTHEESRQESARCLRCDHFGYGVFKGGREYQW